MSHHDPRHDPHGPEQIPDEQPPPDPTDLTNQTALRYGASSRWLVPSAVLALIVIVLAVIAFQLQVVVPTIAIVFVVTLWLVMLVLSRRRSDVRRRNHAFAWIMGGMAVGSAALFFVLYAIEATAAFA